LPFQWQFSEARPHEQAKPVDSTENCRKLLCWRSELFTSPVIRRRFYRQRFVFANRFLSAAIVPCSSRPRTLRRLRGEFGRREPAPFQPDYQNGSGSTFGHSSYVYQVMQPFTRSSPLGYINIEADNLENRQLPASRSFMIVSLTDRGNALPGLEAGQPVGDCRLRNSDRLHHARRAGPAPERLYRYNVVYRWEFTQLGSEIEMELPAKSKRQRADPAEVHIRRGTSGLVVIGHPMRGAPVQQ